METFLFIVFFVSCIVLVVAVLLQPGKTDAGALFTSGVSSAAMNPRGTASVLSKLTIVAATVFMLSALLLSLPAVTGNVSVLETEEEQPVQSATDTNSNSENPESNNSNASTSNSDDKSEESRDADKSEEKSGTESGDSKSEDSSEKGASDSEKKEDGSDSEEGSDANKEEESK